jgi:hypothetical protein
MPEIHILFTDYEKSSDTSKQINALEHTPEGTQLCLTGAMENM